MVDTCGFKESICVFYLCDLFKVTSAMLDDWLDCRIQLVDNFRMIQRNFHSNWHSCSRDPLPLSPKITTNAN